MKRIFYNLVAAAIVMFVLMMVPKIQPNVAATPKTAAQLYSRYCVACHGRDGRSQTSKGKFSHARDLTDAKWQDDVTDERIFNSITNGRKVRGNMPGFKDKLNEKDVDSLVGMVRGFRK
jgi:mono/diheme cytochrome c family protein